MPIETNVDLKPYNTFGLSAVVPALARIRSEADLLAIIADPQYAKVRKYVLGGGSNIVPRATTPPMMLKVEIMGRRSIRETESECIVEAGAGEKWDDVVAWTLANAWPGLENLALIPGTVGAAPIQNIGAYGVELKDRFLSLDALDLKTGHGFSLTAAQCRFGYRDSIFKHELADRCMITRVRLRLPKPWQPMLDYPDLQQRRKALGNAALHARHVYEWVCALRRAKLPDPALLGNAGSFFKNPIIGREQYAALIGCAPDLACYPLPDGRVKLSAGWMIEACGWKGNRMDHVGVHDQQALVLVNHGGATAQEVMALADAIQNSVFQRFGVRLEMEPTMI